MTETVETPQESLEAWREEMFLEMGFDLRDAKLLSQAKDSGWLVDTHHVRKLLRLGCSHGLALRIVL